MKRTVALILLTLTAGGILFWALLPQSGTQISIDKQGAVPVLKVSGPIDPKAAHAIVQGLKRIENSNPPCVILCLASTGGHPAQIFRVAQELRSLSIPTISYVVGDCAGMGVILASTDRIYATPESIIAGSPPAAATVEPSVASAIAEFKQITLRELRTTAPLKGHDAEIFAAMEDPDIELRAADRLISASGVALSLTGAEALSIGLVSGTPRTLEELLLVEKQLPGTP